MTLTEFLLARVAEDEEWATVAGHKHDAHTLPCPACQERALAECESKRRIVEAAGEASALDQLVDHDRRVGVRDATKEPYIGDVILRALAAVYADHPDYRDEWRP